MIPALLGLFQVEREPRSDRSDGWIGVARHWQGGTLRMDLDRFTGSEEPDSILVVTDITTQAGAQAIEDTEWGESELPADIPTHEEREERQQRYQSARRNDDSNGASAVKAYLDALPDWKREVATRFDEIIAQEVTEVRRAVKWHIPFYGIESEGWFASSSAFSKHVKLSFICTAYLDPKPPNGTRSEGQALDVKETDELDGGRIASWVRQAAADPGMGW